MRFFRSDEEEDEDDINKTYAKDDEGSESTEAHNDRLLKPRKQPGALPEKWLPERQKEHTLDSMLQSDGGGAVEFAPEKRLSSKKIRITICGRYIVSSSTFLYPYFSCFGNAPNLSRILKHSNPPFTLNTFSIIHC